MSAYDSVQKGALNLKVPGPIVKKKKKSKEKELKKRMLDQASIGKAGSQDKQAGTSIAPPVLEIDSRTRAEVAFERAKEKRIVEEMLKKPLKTHKERIMEFNEHLDNLSEHYDIPKVSWTK